MIDISIIMPVFNGEGTLARTLQSVSSQLKQKVEIVIIDDGSTDATSEILTRFAARMGAFCQIIRQENAGAASARNRGIAAANGEYLVFLDADDQLSDLAISTIQERVSKGIDILGWDWTNMRNGRSSNYRQSDYSKPEDAIKNLMGGTMKWNLWLFAIKRQLVLDNSISFLEGSDMGEDMAFILKCFASAKTVEQIHESLYKYNITNPTSISQELNERRRGEVTRNLVSAVLYLQRTTFADICQEYLPHLKLYIKLPLLISTSERDYQTWYNWFPEANAYAMNNLALPLRTRLLQGLASKQMWRAVKFYNILYRQVVCLRYR